MDFSKLKTLAQQSKDSVQDNASQAKEKVASSFFDGGGNGQDECLSAIFLGV